MLKSIFTWLDAHPSFYLAALSGPTLALIGWITLDLFRPRKEPSSKWNECLFAALLFVFLLAWRWPHLFSASELNPDESQHLAGALKLMQDPVFWHSVDGVTSGPLNFYVLLPLHLLGAPLDYFTARLLCVLLAWAGLLACYRFVRTLAPFSAARLAILPASVFFATVTDHDFLQYSTEHIPMMLTAFAALFLLSARTTNTLSLIFGGLAAGFIPWAKLQGVPIAITLIMWKCAEMLMTPDSWRTNLRRCSQLLFAALAPSIVILGIVIATRQFNDFWISYIWQNLVYVSNHYPLGTVLHDLANSVDQYSSLPAFIAGTLFILLLCGGCYLRVGLQPRRYFMAGAVLTLAAVACALIPRRAFLHYLLLMIVPLTLWGGAALGEVWKQVGNRTRGLLAAAILIVAVIVPLSLRFKDSPPEMFGQFTEHWKHPRSIISNIVHGYSSNGDRLAIWGWLSNVYVESKRPQATRDTVNFWAIAPSSTRDYYRNRYLADLQKTRPQIFVDAVGPGAQFFKIRLHEAHENFPALALYIKENYSLLIDLGYGRIYLRNGLQPKLPIDEAHLRQLIVNARQEAWTDWPADHLTPAGARHERVANKWVQMLLPPAEMMWNLHGTERAIRLDYGFLPKAFREGYSDGVEIIGELRHPARTTQQVFYRLLDPHHVPADAGPQTVTLILPPYDPGTTLVVRTAPGQFGNDAWDWAYVARMRVQRAPLYLQEQYPAFNRVPENVTGRAVYYIEENKSRLLMTHAPAVYSFLLSGEESRIDFNYGFLPGAYENGGQTDGAVFRVELQHANEPARIVFERQLLPLNEPSDRGRQYIDLKLPKVTNGDRLFLRIEPGANNSWDWTYITHLNLR